MSTMDLVLFVTPDLIDEPNPEELRVRFAPLYAEGTLDLDLANQSDLPLKSYPNDALTMTVTRPDGVTISMVTWIRNPYQE